MWTDSRGLALIDVVAATSLSLVMAAMAVPVIGGTLDREHTIVGAQYLAGQVRRARLEALRRGTSVAVRVVVLDGRASVQLFADGNGNGVLTKDIDKSIDVPLTPVDWLDLHARHVSLRINQSIRDVSGNGDLAAGDDPVRIGNTSLVSFSPLGGSTSGTLYLASQRGPQMAIRLYGATGRVRVLRFDAQARQWRT